MQVVLKVQKKVSQRACQPLGENGIVIRRKLTDQVRTRVLQAAKTLGLMVVETDHKTVRISDGNGSPGQVRIDIGSSSKKRVALDLLKVLITKTGLVVQESKVAPPSVTPGTTKQAYNNASHRICHQPQF